MSIGYEGYIKLGSTWTLGTGASVPKGRQRLDSQAAYGGKVSHATELAIGSPHTYDWTTWDGSVNFDMTSQIFTILKGFILTTRDTNFPVLFSARDQNVQEFTDSIWNSINISTSEASPVSGSVGFVAMDRTTYVFGSDIVKETGMSEPYDANMEVIPYWKTSIGDYKFLEWTLDFSQDVVKFFGCNWNVGVQSPIFYGVGPMSVTLTGTILMDEDELEDDPGNLLVTIGTGTITLKDTELQTESDDVKTGNEVVPISVTIDAYGLA
jgi:hypothetical protein